MINQTVKDFDKISPTAILVAYARQFSDIPYSKEIAELTNALTRANQIWNYQQEEQVGTIGLAALIEGRYKTIEQVRARFLGTQILELASGLLPRGMIATQDPAITFIESDLPGMIQQKQPLIKQLIGDRPNLHLLEINATNSLDFLVLKHYFQPDQPVTILCEGLLPYLTFTEKQQVFSNVREILQTYGGVWITSDMPTKAGRERVEDIFPKYRLVRQRISSLTERPFSDNEFEHVEEAKEFAQQQGFQSEEFSMLAVLNQLTSPSRLNIESNLVTKMLTQDPVFAFTLA